MKNAKKTRTTDEILMGSSRKRRAFEVFNYLLLTFMGVISLLPVWHILMKSFSAPESVEAGLVKLLPVNFSTFSYEFILQKKEFYTAFFVSVKRVLLGVPARFFAQYLQLIHCPKRTASFMDAGGMSLCSLLLWFSAVG